ncbi:MAG: hypothetical protein L0H73_09980 [Nitrococcus sp.]|nr:hypothetical protein [Nitrococcus sp.]
MAEPDPEHSSTEENATPLPLTEIASALLGAGRRFVQHVGELLGLETQRALQALTWMVALAVLAGLLAAGTWLLLLAAAYTALVDLGMGSAAALLLLAALNLLGVIISALIIRRLSSALMFRATRRVLLGEPKHEPFKPPHTRM